MKITRLPLTGRAVVALTIAAIASIAPSAQALPACMTPMVMTSEYAPGDTNTISWVADQSGGFEIQVGADTTFTALVQTASPGPSATDREFTGLGEAQYFYRMRAKALQGMCAQSPWSAAASTIQDSTAPKVDITTRPEPIMGVTPPVPVFIMEDEIRLTGTAVDLPGGTAPSGVGAQSVAIGLENTTPVAGGSEPPVQYAQVSEDGSWQVRYCSNTVACPGGKPSSGTYSVNATGIDAFGNSGDQPSTLALIVVL